MNSEATRVVREAMRRLLAKGQDVVNPPLPLVREILPGAAWPQGARETYGRFFASPAQSMKPRSWAPDCFEWNVPGMVLHSAERWSGDETYVRQLAVAKASQLVKDNPAERSVFAAHSSSRFQMWLITARPSSFADKLIEALMGSAIEVVGVLSSILALSEQDVPVEPLDRLFVSNGCIHSLSIEPGTSKSRTSLESQITNVLTACSAAIGDLPVRLRRAHGLAKSMRRSSLRERSLRVLERWS